MAARTGLRLPPALARLAREESGWTLMELLVVMVVMIVVIGAIGNVLSRSLVIGSREVERPSALGEVQVGLTRMQREARQTYQILYASGTVLDVLARLATGSGGARQYVRVVYKCDDPSPKVSGLKACDRYQKVCASAPCAGSDTSNPGTAPVTDPSRPCATPSAPWSCSTVIDRIQNGTGSDPVFTNADGSPVSYGGSGTPPTYIAGVVKTPQKGERSVGNKASFILNGGIYFRNLDVKSVDS